MKARVKATGEIVEITSGVICIDKNDHKQTIHSDFIEPYIDINTDNDYWEKLKHQYAGMAMQGMLGNSDYIERFTMHTIDGISHEDDLARCAKDYATALVNRLKEEEK